MHSNLIKQLVISSNDNQDEVDFDKKFNDFSVKKYLDALSKSGIGYWNQLGFKRALRIFKSASKRIPAYRDFLKKNHINAAKIISQEDYSKVPTVNKKNYISQYPIADCLWDGKIKNVSMFSVSSGSTGQPTFWPRGNYLEYETTLIHEIQLETFFEISRKKTLAIVCYSMGMYVAGTFTTFCLQKLARKGYQLYCVTPGIDVEEVMNVLMNCEIEYDQIILFGYPPFIKDVIDELSTKKINIKKKRIGFVFGAENFSEEWRDNLVSLVNGFSSTSTSLSMNTYGSADAAIIGYETPLSIKLRRAINESGLNEQIFGQYISPSLMQYNPVMKYVEVDNNMLIFTSDAGIPLVRYDIGDRGGFLSPKEINNFGVDTKLWGSMPMLYLLGRNTNVATIYGLNVYPETIKHALEDKRIIKYLSGKFRIETAYDDNYDQFLKILIETVDVKELLIETQNLVKEIIVETLRKINYEYNQLHTKIGEKADPKVTFLPRGSYQQAKSKHRWIVKN